ncbi:glycosyltransferase family 1 protein, partial [bacterium]|nr:glycosyltransferase family 1 protein [bacterium]
MRKVIFLANYDWYLYNFKLTLAEAVRDAGFDVVLATPPGDYAERFAARGFRWIPFPMSRHGMNPLREAATLVQLVRLYRRERPFLAHQFTAKAVIYGSIASRLAGPPRRINAITGGASAMGTVIGEDGWRTRALRRALRGLLRYSLRDSEVIFQNPDDLGAFVSGGVVSADRVHLVRGSGVDPDEFPMVTPPPGPPVVVFASRLLRTKGVYDFVEA